MSQLALDLLQPPLPSFDNFVVGRNAEALARLRALAAGEFGSFAERVVYLWGPAGCGRSHLLQSLAGSAATPPWSPKDPVDVRGLSIVDDVDALADVAQVALFNRINAVRARSDAAVIAAGSAAPAQLPLREDLRSRLAWGLVFQVQPLTDEEKIGALREQAAARGVAMADDVPAWLLAHLPRDMRTLSAALDALDALALAQQKKRLTTALIREWQQQAAP